MKLSGYVAAYREDMAMVMALVKFFFCNMHVIYFYLVFSRSYLIFLSLLPRFLKRPHVREEERSCMIPSADPYQVSNLVL